MNSTSENIPNTAGVLQPSLKVPVVKDIHIEADTLIKDITHDFENKLRLQSNLLAQDDELILKIHVREALTIIRRNRSRIWKEELPILLGGALFGTFLQGFANELSLTETRLGWIAVYVVAGIIGLTLIFYGFLKQHMK